MLGVLSGSKGEEAGLRTAGRPPTPPAVESDAGCLTVLPDMMFSLTLLKMGLSFCNFFLFCFVFRVTLATFVDQSTSQKMLVS